MAELKHRESEQVDLLQQDFLFPVPVFEPIEERLFYLRPEVPEDDLNLDPLGEILTST